MSIFFKSKRIGKNGKPFFLWKFRTLKEGSEERGSFAEEYTRFGKFLRKTKTDELPQIINILRGEINIVGPRPEEERNISVLPEETKNILLSRKPGLTSLASIHFFEEGQILNESPEIYKDYWTKIKPLKITLDCFYIQHRNLLLDWWIILKTISLMIKSFFK